MNGRDFVSDDAEEHTITVTFQTVQDLIDFGDGSFTLHAGTEFPLVIEIITVSGAKVWLEDRVQGAISTRQVLPFRQAQTYFFTGTWFIKTMTSNAHLTSVVDDSTIEIGSTTNSVVLEPPRLSFATAPCASLPR